MFSTVIGTLFGLAAFSLATPVNSGVARNCKKALFPPSSAGKLAHTGINIAGFDFGCATDGVSPITVEIPSPSMTLKLICRRAKLLLLGHHLPNFTVNPISPLEYRVSSMFLFSGNDGAGQIKHFVKNDGFNTFRLPVGWQFLTNDVKSGVLNAANFAKYDALVQVISHACSCNSLILSAL